MPPQSPFEASPIGTSLPRILMERSGTCGNLLMKWSPELLGLNPGTLTWAGRGGPRKEAAKKSIGTGLNRRGILLNAEVDGRSFMGTSLIASGSPTPEDKR